MANDIHEMIPINDSCFESLAGAAEEFGGTVSEDAILLFMKSEHADYEGWARILYWEDGKLWSVHGSHCSCYGFEGQWDPEEEDIEAFIMHDCVEGNEDRYLREAVEILRQPSFRPSIETVPKTGGQMAPSQISAMRILDHLKKRSWEEGENISVARYNGEELAMEVFAEQESLSEDKLSVEVNLRICITLKPKTAQDCIFDYRDADVSSPEE